ncbi:MAG: hydroxymethylbilane synthase [Betaproteobacteria bacterium]
MSNSSFPQRLVIATRESPLALYQANHVAALLRGLYPATTVELLGMTTRGDQILDRSLAAVGGKGLFIKELEEALADGRADLAVHSLKDVPMDLPDGFALAAILPREDPHDAFVSNRFSALSELPPGAVVGTSSLRREAALRAAWPQLRTAALRGNVGTRLRKLDDGQYDAIILAVAGLKRLGLGERIKSVLPPEQSLPAVGQGALAIETLASRADLLDLVKPLDDADTAACTRAERAFSRGLSGSCQTPLAAHAVIRDDRLWLRGFLARPDGGSVLRGEVHGDRENPEIAGRTLADDFLTRGAAAILAQTGSSQ